MMSVAVLVTLAIVTLWRLSGVGVEGREIQVTIHHQEVFEVSPLDDRELRQIERDIRQRRSFRHVVKFEDYDQYTT